MLRKVRIAVTRVSYGRDCSVSLLETDFRLGWGVPASFVPAVIVVAKSYSMLFGPLYLIAAFPFPLWCKKIPWMISSNFCTALGELRSYFESGRRYSSKIIDMLVNFAPFNFNDFSSSSFLGFV